MKISKIELAATGKFSKLFLDYLNRNDNLNPFYNFYPELESFKKAIPYVSQHTYNRKILVETIHDQYKFIKNKPDGIDLLSEDKTFTVCTGHQLCLFTGPLYFIHKILSTINLAEELKIRFPEYNFVPIFWPASEDHDFEEANHAFVNGKKVEWKNKQGGALGRYNTTGIEEVVKELHELIGDSENTKDLVELFTKAYKEHSNYADATRYIINELFGKYGLIIVDGNDVRLKNQMENVFEDEFTNHSSYKYVSETVTKLEALGYKAQVHPREINLFELTANDRIRIESAESQRLDTSVLSPNVVLRCLYQQKILPNLAYVGGPGETAYWLEYRAMFDYFNVPYPILIPRHFGMIVNKSLSEQMMKLGMTAKDIFLPDNQILENYFSTVSPDREVYNKEKTDIVKQLQEAHTAFSKLDQTKPSAEGAKLKKQLNELDSAHKKLIRSYKKKNEVVVLQLEKIKQELMPRGGLQERHENFIPFYLEYGEKLIEILKENFSSFDSRFVVFECEIVAQFRER